MSYPTRDGMVTAVFYLKDDGTVVGIDHPEDPRIGVLLRKFQESTPNLSTADRTIVDNAFRTILTQLLADM